MFCAFIHVDIVENIQYSFHCQIKIIGLIRANTIYAIDITIILKKQKGNNIIFRQGQPLRKKNMMGITDGDDIKVFI